MEQTWSERNKKPTGIDRNRQEKTGLYIWYRKLLNHKEIPIWDRKSRIKGKSHWEKRDGWRRRKKPVSKTAKDRGQKLLIKRTSLAQIWWKQKNISWPGAVTLSSCRRIMVNDYKNLLKPLKRHNLCWKNNWRLEEMEGFEGIIGVNILLQ